MAQTLDHITMQSLEWQRITNALASHIATPYGATNLASLGPLHKISEVRRSLGRIGEMARLIETQGPLPLISVAELEPLLERATKGGRLETPELRAVLETLRVGRDVCARLRRAEDSPLLGWLADGFAYLNPLAEALAAALTAEGELNERAFPRLVELRQDIAERRATIHRHLESLLQAQQWSRMLQDHIYSLRGSRYVVPVKADFKGQLPGIVHDVSSSGATLFVEPQVLVEETNVLTLAEKHHAAEVDAILLGLAAQVGAVAGELSCNAEWLGRIDLIHAQALLARGYDGTVPWVEPAVPSPPAPQTAEAMPPAADTAQRQISSMSVANPAQAPSPSAASGNPYATNSLGHTGKPGESSGPGGPSKSSAPRRPQDTGGLLDLKGLAHPLLLLGGSPVVRNDVRLGGERRCLIVSGANTGGKTVLLKAVGLSLLLVRHGMPIPAQKGSRVDWFYVAADIGDQQTLAGSLSTFSAQIKTLVAMQAAAAPGCVLLIDELLTSTEPRHGASLAAAALKFLTARGALCLVTTHYGELKGLAGASGGFANGAMSFDVARMQPTFRLLEDVPGASHAFSISQRCGLDPEIVDEARVALEAQGLGSDTLLEQLQARERELEQREARTTRMRQEAERARERNTARERELKQRTESLRQRERRQVGSELARARRRISAVLRDLQQKNTPQAVEQARERLATLEQEAQERLPPKSPPPLAPFDAQSAAPGDMVYLPGVERTAELVEWVAGEDRARLRMGGLVFQVALGELAAPPPDSCHRKPSKTTGKHRRGNDATAGTPGPQEQGLRVPGLVLQGDDNVLDMRGLRLHEALERADQFFDLCVVKHISPVLIIHGHGTGRLKMGLRSTLDDSPYVAAFRPGAAGEGGDGVTVVALNL